MLNVKKNLLFNINRNLKFILIHLNIMEKFKNNLSTLRILSCCSKKTRGKILKSSKKELIRAINECILNTLNGNIKLSPIQKKILEKHKYILRKLINNKFIGTKKKILIQKGGFLQFILPSAITLISSILENLKK
jgi:hypothetical protein